MVLEQVYYFTCQEYSNWAMGKRDSTSNRLLKQHIREFLQVCPGPYFWAGPGYEARAIQGREDMMSLRCDKLQNLCGVDLTPIISTHVEMHCCGCTCMCPPMHRLNPLVVFAILWPYTLSGMNCMLK